MNDEWAMETKFLYTDIQDFEYTASSLYIHKWNYVLWQAAAEGSSPQLYNTWKKLNLHVHFWDTDLFKEKYSTYRS